MRGFCGRAFALDPDLAAFVELFLPNWHTALQLADRPLARLEGGAAVRRADGDTDAGLPDFEPARAVDDAQMRHLEPLARLAPQPPHLGQGHRRVRLVDKVER